MAALFMSFALFNQVLSALYIRYKYISNV